MSHKPTENRTREPKGDTWITYIYMHTMYQYVNNYYYNVYYVTYALYYYKHIFITILT